MFQIAIIKKILKILDHFEDWFNAIVLLGTTALLFINVVLRYFDMSITWAEEASRYLIAWLAFVGGSLCVKHGEHVGIDLLVQVSSPRMKKFLILSSELIATIFMLFFTYYGGKLTLSTFETGQISTGIMMPMWIVYSAIPIGCFLMAIRFFQRFIKTLRKKADASLIKVDDSGNVDISRL